MECFNSHLKYSSRLFSEVNVEGYIIFAKMQRGQLNIYSNIKILTINFKKIICQEKKKKSFHFSCESPCLNLFVGLWKCYYNYLCIKCSEYYIFNIKLSPGCSFSMRIEREQHMAAVWQRWWCSVKFMYIAVSDGGSVNNGKNCTK